MGGSLLGLPDFAQRILRWTEQQTPLTNVLIVGGGLMVENLRRECAEQNVDDATAHRLAVQAMSVTARLVATSLEIPLLSDITRDLDVVLAATATESLVALDVYGTVCGDGAGKGPCDLPQNWRVTSDSIAAWVAQETRAAELVLLKSALPEKSCHSWAGAAESGYVDLHFPEIAPELEAIGCVNLSDDTFPEWTASA